MRIAARGRSAIDTACEAVLACAASNLGVMSGYLSQPVLVLNRLWQAVNVCSAKRALTLLFQGHAQAVLGDNHGSFQTFDFNEWHDLSLQQPHPESIHTVSFKIRVPRVILL